MSEDELKELLDSAYDEAFKRLNLNAIMQKELEDIGLENSFNEWNMPNEFKPMFTMLRTAMKFNMAFTRLFIEGLKKRGYV